MPTQCPRDGEARSDRGMNTLKMSTWLLAALLAVGAHFSASSLVPLDQTAQRTFGGLLRWTWPWAYGDRGVLGTITPPSGLPGSGLLLALPGAAAFALAALAVLGWWVPFTWWRLLAGAGAVLQLVLMVLFLAPTKVLPIAFDVLILYLLWSRSATPLVR